MNNIKQVPKNLGKKVIILLLALSGPIFLMLTDPTELALPLLVVPFLWLFLTLFVVTTWLTKRKFIRLTKSRSIILAGMVATLPVLLLVFQSIHQLSVKDILLSLGIIALAAFYLDRADFIR